jgi:hypothetical protein
MKHSGLLLGILLLAAGGISCSMDGGSGGSTTGGSPTVASPAFSLSSGTYYGIQFLTMTTTTDGAVIHYTTDGNTPTASSPVYSSYIPVKKTESVKAVAVKDGVISPAASALYTMKYLFVDSSLCNSTPGYWNNGNRISLQLPDGAVKAVTLQCDISDSGDIVVDGYFYNDTNGVTYPCYWKNGVCCKMDVSGTGSWGRPNPNGIAFQGNDIYIGGWEYVVSSRSGSTTTYKQVPCYWKNTECNELSVPGTSDNIDTYSSVEFSDTGSIYITGTLYTSGGTKPCYWKDGECKILPFPSGYINGRTENCSLCKDDVYITGNVDSKPCYWKNGVYYPLNAPSLSDSTESGYRFENVFLNGTDTYVNGYSYVCGTSTGGAWIMSPVYCKNGNLVTLSLPAVSAQNLSGGVWWFEKAGDTVVMHGSWSDNGEYADCYWVDGTYDGVTYSKNSGSETDGTSLTSGVYACGLCKNSQKIKTAGYWVNGTWHELTVPDTSSEESIAEFITVHDSDIYTAGYYECDSENSYVQHAGYWKNSVWNTFTNPYGSGYGSWCTSFYVSGDDVYASGSCYRGKNSTSQAGYWKNNEWHELNSPYTYNGSATTDGLTISGTSVYVCGWCWISSGSKTAGYWKDGTWTELTNPYASTEWQSADTDSIVVSGSHIYVSGICSSRADAAAESTDVAGYWEDGIWNELHSPYSSDRNYPCGLAVAGSSVYVGGDCFFSENSDYGQPGYWLNGTWHGFSSPEGTDPAIRSLFVSGQDVYAGGSCYSGQEGYKTGSAGYWKNGTWYSLKNPYSETEDSHCYSVITVP